MRGEKKIDQKKSTLIFSELRDRFSSDWLLPLEMYELFYNSNSKIEVELLEYLNQMKESKRVSDLITSGINIIIQN